MFRYRKVYHVYWLARLETATGLHVWKKSLRAQHQIAEKPAKNPGTPRRAKGLWAESILYRFPILLPVLQAQHRELPGSSTLKDWSKPTKF